MLLHSQVMLPLPHHQEISHRRHLRMVVHLQLPQVKPPPVLLLLVTPTHTLLIGTLLNHIFTR